MSNETHKSILFDRISHMTIQMRILDILCCILVVLGIFGNLLGLFIFSSSRRTWRISSIYAFLATCSSITNLLCVLRYGSILHSTTRNLLHDLVERYWWACKFYEFSFSFRVIASWITLFWMFERLMCVSKRLQRCFHHCYCCQFQFIVPVAILIAIVCCTIGPPVYMYQAESPIVCDLNSKASIQWKKYFHEIHFGFNHFTIRCLFSELLPTGAVILFNFYIVSHLIHTHRRLDQPPREHSRTTSWMNIVLLLHALLFLASLLSHIVGHLTVSEAHEAWWVLLAILINSSMNFYLYCLSGKAFRNEIYRLIQKMKIQLFHKCHIREDRCCGNNEMDIIDVVIPLRRQHINDFHR